MEAKKWLNLAVLVVLGIVSVLVMSGEADAESDQLAVLVVRFAALSVFAGVVFVGGKLAKKGLLPDVSDED